MNLGTLPRRLHAPAPTWTRDVDVVVLGSGAAGLAAALAVRPVRSVLIVTKDTLDAGSTAWAQGGLAGVLDPQDSLENHVRDTLAAGAGLCDEQAVRTLVTEAPKALRYLIRLGAAFDPSHDGGGPALTREGGHSHNRIVHSGGDRSGAEVQRTLDENALAAGVEVLDRCVRARPARRHLAGRDAPGGRCAHRHGSTTTARCARSATVTGARRGAGHRWVRAGVRQHVEPAGGHRRRPGAGAARRARRRATSSSSSSIPTVLWVGPDATGQQALISEAVRGEGAVLYDAAGVRVMAGVHPQEDLAPRDVVAAAINRRMAEAPAGVDDHVFLDATHLGERFYDRFPSITEACRAAGIDPARRADPGRPGGALRLRRRARRPRPAAPSCSACTPSARWRAPACTAPTGWPATA